MIDKELQQSTSKPNKQLHFYSAEQRAKMGKYAAENGNKAAVTKFSALLGHTVPESTIRGFKTKYLSKLKETKGAAVTALPHAARGRPLKLGA